MPSSVLSAFAGIGLADWPNHCVIWGFNHTTRSEPASLVRCVLNNLYRIEADAQKHNDQGEPKDDGQSTTEISLALSSTYTKFDETRKHASALILVSSRNAPIQTESTNHLVPQMGGCLQASA